jgi:hypothetical protein
VGVRTIQSGDKAGQTANTVEEVMAYDDKAVGEEEPF